MTIHEKRAVAQGDMRIPQFSGAIEFDYSLNDGDVITIPNNFQVYAQKTPNGRISEYIFVTNQYGEVKKLYPSVFTKKVMTENGEIYVTDGSAVDMYISNVSVQEGICALIGKKIFVRIKFVTSISGRILRVYTFDLV